MVEPLIKNVSNWDNEYSESFWKSGKSFVANSYAKILWRKKFKKSEIQQYDDQIVSVVQEVYLPPEQRKDEVWDWILDRTTSFLVHAAYKHRSEDVVLICYRGTDFKNMKDLFSDVQIVLGVNWIDGRVQDSLDFFDEIQMKYPNAKKWVCGHSLWWTISYIVTKHRLPDRCVVFNPWASPTTVFLGMMQDTLFKRSWTKIITTYKIWWDAISTLGFIWNVKSFVLKTANPLKLHSIDSFPELFEKEKSVQSIKHL